MHSERVGIITFFGILIPGSYLLAIIVLVVASTLEAFGLGGHASVFEFASANVALSAAVFLFASYLLGMVVRLFAPRVVDELSKWYFVHLRRKRNGWVADVFPYRRSLTSWFAKGGMAKIPALLQRVNPHYGDDNNTLFFNYCKWFVDANHVRLSRQIQEAEALVRFLSGTTLALMIGLSAFLVFSVVFSIAGSPICAMSYISLSVGSALMLCLILERFKHQRRREVIMVWSAVHLLLTGATQEIDWGDRVALKEFGLFTERTGGGKRDDAQHQAQGSD
jgi:hypothetical protein